MNLEIAKKFQTTIVSWFRKNGRDLPWRRTTDPYKIWISEIMCQQTGVATVVPYYERFIDRFPTVDALALSKESDVIKLWEGLGYYSRAKNLRKGAQLVVKELGGDLPSGREELLKIPGIGNYSAGAILAIAFKKSEATLDGNYIRIFSRYFGIEEDVKSTKTLKQLWQLARDLTPKSSQTIRDYTEGLMDFGALVCRPKQAQCSVCPLRKTCWAHQNDKVDQLPYKAKRQKRLKLREEIVVIKEGEKIAFLKKGTDPRYPHFYRLPYRPVEKKSPPRRILGKLKYSITHRDYEVFVTEKKTTPTEIVWKTSRAIQKISLPAIDRKVLRLYEERRS